MRTSGSKRSATESSNLRSGDVKKGSGLMSHNKKTRAVQHNRRRHWSQLVAMPDNSGSSGSEGSRISPRATKRDHFKPDVSPSCGPFPHKRTVTVSSSHPHVDFLTKWFAASTKFLVDDDVVANENDAVASLIVDVSMVQQLGRLFALRSNNSPFVDLHGQVQRQGQLISGDLGSAGHASKTSARIRAPGSCCTLASPCSQGSMSMECNLS